MFTYIIRRLLLMIPTMIGISVLVFFLINMVPGGPIEQAIQQMRGGGGGGQEGGGTDGVASGLTEEAIADLKKYYGFDKPLIVRYFTWLGKVMRLDFGKSYTYKKPVFGMIMDKVPISLKFGIPGFLLTYLICVPLGVLKAVRHRSFFDSSTSALVFAGYAIPNYALGMLLLVLFGGGSFWDVFPLGGLKSPDHDSFSFFGRIWDHLYHMILPLTCYLIGGFATLTMLQKNSMLDNLASDYVRTARAKGLASKAVLFKHALRNSLIPVATGIGNILGIFVAGSLLIEVVFNINGMSYMSYEALGNRDYPVTLGVIMILSVLTLVGNLISDICYVLIDPRISFDAR
ncbi:MAG: ABC transporter permease subunit [Acidobacteriota bacterium]